MNEALDLLVRSVPILIGGGTVQFIIAMLKRRSEMRLADASAGKTDAESGSVVVSSAERSVALAGQLRDDAVKRAAEVSAELDSQLARVKRLRTRLGETAAEVAELRTEVALLRREVARLQGLINITERPTA